MGLQKKESFYETLVTKYSRISVQDALTQSKTDATVVAKEDHDDVDF